MTKGEKKREPICRWLTGEDLQCEGKNDCLLKHRRIESARRS
jgi:hypothetical protein